MPDSFGPEGDDRAATVADLRQTLLASANIGGGWGYYPKKRSRIEPTSWALLALAESASWSASERQAFAAPHLQFLARCQSADGLLVDALGMPPNLTSNGIAACTLIHLDSASQSTLVTRLLRGIVSVKGALVSTRLERTIATVKRLLGATPAEETGQDNSLQAWPWIPDTFSWMEPTSWCLLALKKARPSERPPGADERIREADAVLLNRVCATGGWNYGNAAAFGQDLRAYVPTTAVGLIALQDRLSEPQIERTKSFLSTARLKESSGMALGLTALALRICQLPLDDVERQLSADVGRVTRLGNVQTLATTLFALSADRHEARALRV